MDDRHYPHPKQRVLGHGNLLVTGHGHVIIEERLRRSRALLVRSIEAVYVAFSADDPPCPPCSSSAPDELSWETIERHRGELYLKINWRVSCARTINWKVFEIE